MEEKKTVKFKDLPDTINYLDYAGWRQIGENNARNIFHSKGFPLIKGVGNKLLADKRAVLLWDLGINNPEEFAREFAKELVKEVV